MDQVIDKGFKLWATLHILCDGTSSQVVLDGRESGGCAINGSEGIAVQVPELLRASSDIIGGELCKAFVRRGLRDVIPDLLCAAVSSLARSYEFHAR